MINNSNIKAANKGQTITIGRINGKIKAGDKIYKTVSILLNKEMEQISSKENIKRDIDCKIIIKENTPITLSITDKLSKIVVEKTGAIPEKAENIGLTEERIKEQLSKLGNTIFKINNIEVELGDKLITSISNINEIRRNAIQELEEKIKLTFIRKEKKAKYENINESDFCIKEPQVNLCLNNINETMDYEKIQGVDNVYIPLRFFAMQKLESQIQKICNKFNTYLLMPAISKSNYEKIDMEDVLKNNIKGIVVSNLSQIEMLKNYKKRLHKKESNIDILDKRSLQNQEDVSGLNTHSLQNIVANYTLNISNNHTIQELKKRGITRYTISPEFEKDTIRNLSNIIPKEVIVYGRTLLMTTEYCAIGTYKNCVGTCANGEYKLKDRMGFEFPIKTDRINCNNLIYNSKITSIEWKELNVDSIRIDILDEDIEQINEIIKTHKNGKRLEGKDYTNGNLNKEI